MRLKALSVATIVLFSLCSGQSALAQSNRNLAVARPDAASNQKRVALVIGNNAYANSPLKNPVNDARAMAAKLRTLGFEVIARENLTIKEIGPTLREFRSKLVPGAVALFYYAGHGVQVKGSNYFPVVDADISSEDDVSLQALDLGKILELLDEAKTRLNLVFLDACRNNPYLRSFRSSANGLAKVEAPSGTLMSFATRPGSVASDGAGKNGLYTEKLLLAMNDTGQPIELALKRVVSGVKAASNGQQEPWMEGSIEGDFCFGNCSASSAAPAPAEAMADAETVFWGSVKDSTNALELKAYLDKYPQGQFANLARIRIAGIEGAAKSEKPDNSEKAEKPQGPLAALARQGLGSSPADALVKTFVGKHCNGWSTAEYRVQGNLLRGEMRNYGSLLAIGAIAIDSARYLGTKNGVHYLGYRVISERVQDKRRNTSDVIVETNFSSFKMIGSTNVEDGAVTIRNGVAVSNNASMPIFAKCGS